MRHLAASSAACRAGVVVFGSLVVAALLLLPMEAIVLTFDRLGLGPWLEDLLRASGDSSTAIPADKLAHVSLFAGLTLVVFWATGAPRWWPWAVAATLVLYGFLLEWLQGALGVRSQELLDALCNALGVALSTFGWLVVTRRLASTAAAGWTKRQQRR